MSPRRIFLLGLGISIWSFAFLYTAAARSPLVGTIASPTHTPGYEIIHGPGEFMLAQGDGQSHAQVARHPTLDHPIETFGSRSAAAYRGMRPLYGWATWMVSGGQAAWTIPAMVGLLLVGCGLLAWSLRPYAGALAPLAVLMPGVAVSIDWITPEPIGLAFALLGLGNPLWFIGAALVRETFLVFPAAGFLATRDRRMLYPFVAWGGWQIIVRLRVGEWFFAENQGQALAPPFVGLWRKTMPWTHMDLFVFTLTVACIVAGLWSARWRLLTGVHALLASMLGWDTWRRWEDFSRPLLPLYAIGLAVAWEKGMRWSESRSTRTLAPKDGQAVPSPTRVGISATARAGMTGDTVVSVGRLDGNLP